MRQNATSAPVIQYKSPLLRLPSALWIVVIATIGCTPNKLAILENALMALIATCRDLRGIILATPHIWSTIRITGSIMSSTMLTRSASTPLRVRFDASECLPVLVERAWSSLFHHLHHIETLHVSVDMRDDQWGRWTVSDLLLRPAPSLRTLVVDGTWAHSRSRLMLTEQSIGRDWNQLSSLSLQGLRFDASITYPALSCVTRFQYTGFGHTTPEHLRYILQQMPNLQILGVASDTIALEFVDTEPATPPRTLRQVTISDAFGDELESLVRFFSAVPTVYARPDDVSYHAMGFLHEFTGIPVAPWNHLVRMNCRWRRALVEFRTSSVDQNSNALIAYARREHIVEVLRVRPSANALTLLSLDEGTWSFLAFGCQLSADSPIALPRLLTMRITLSPCVFAKYTFGTTGCTIWSSPDTFGLFDVPHLQALQIIHLSVWTCPRVDAMNGSVSPLPCWCRNNGTIALVQVVDLLKHGRAVRQGHRIRNVTLFGVMAIVDDDCCENARALEAIVDELAILVNVPNALVEEDAEVSRCNGTVVHSCFDEDADFRF